MHFTEAIHLYTDSINFWASDYYVTLRYFSVQGEFALTFQREPEEQDYSAVIAPTLDKLRCYLSRLHMTPASREKIEDYLCKIAEWRLSRT